MSAALEFLKDFSKPDTSVACWVETKWNTKWQSNTSRLHTFIPDVNPIPLEMYLARPSWVRLNCLRAGVGLFRPTLYRWGMASTAACECGAEEQTVDHIITSCPIFHHPSRRISLETVDDETVVWLINTCPNI